MNKGLSLEISIFHHIIFHFNICRTISVSIHLLLTRSLLWLCHCLYVCVNTALTAIGLCVLLAAYNEC